MGWLVWMGFDHQVADVHSGNLWPQAEGAAQGAQLPAQFAAFVADQPSCQLADWLGAGATVEHDLVAVAADEQPGRRYRGELIAPIPSKVSVSRHVIGRRSSHRMAPLGSGHDGASRRSAPALRPGTYRHTVPVEGCSARGGERLPMGPVVVPVEQQIGRWAGAGRGHDDHDRGPARAAAGVISPPQGRTPVDQAVGMPQAAAVGWGVHLGTVTMWKHRLHTLSVSAAPGAGQRRSCSC